MEKRDSGQRDDDVAQRVRDRDIGNTLMDGKREEAHLHKATRRIAEKGFEEIQSHERHCDERDGRLDGDSVTCCSGPLN